MLLINLVIAKLDIWQMYSGPCSCEFNIDMRHHIDLKRWNQEHDCGRGKKKTSGENTVPSFGKAKNNDF